MTLLYLHIPTIPASVKITVTTVTYIVYLPTGYVHYVPQCKALLPHCIACPSPRIRAFHVFRRPKLFSTTALEPVEKTYVTLIWVGNLGLQRLTYTTQVVSVPLDTDR